MRAVGLGRWQVLAIIMQDTGLLGRLYAEGHEAVDRSPGRGLTAVARTACKSIALAFYPVVPDLPRAEPVSD